MDKITYSASGTTTYEQGGVMVYQAKVIIQALKACKAGLRLNRAYTPTATLRTAGNITRKAYKRGEYDRAIADLEAWIVERMKTIEVVTER